MLLSLDRHLPCVYARAMRNLLVRIIRKALDLDGIEAYMENACAYIENYPFDEEN